MSPEGQRLIDEATEAVGVQASAAALITGFAQWLRDNAAGNVTLLAKADELDASSTALANAVAANPLPATPPATPGTPPGTPPTNPPTDPNSPEAVASRNRNR